MGEMKTAYKVMLVKAEGKGPINSRRGNARLVLRLVLMRQYTDRRQQSIQSVTGGTDQTSGRCSLC